MDNTHMQGFGQQADSGHSSNVPSSWNESSAKRGVAEGTSIGDGNAFSPVKGAAEQNFATAGRESWSMSDVGRGDNGIPQVHGMDTDVKGSSDSARNNWNGMDDSVGIQFDNGPATK